MSVSARVNAKAKTRTVPPPAAIKDLPSRLPSRAAVETAYLPKDMHEYVRRAWPTLEPARQFVDGWHIGMICEHLEAMARRELKFVVFNVPPGAMKSLLINVMFPSWVWTSHPSERFLCLGAADDLPTRDSMKCRRLIESQWYQDRWQHVYQLTSDQNAKTKYENDKTGVRGIASFAGGVLGERAGFILVDDPHKTDIAESDTVREGKLRKFREEVYTRREDENAVVGIIMQRLNARDLSGFVLAEGWADAHVCVPMRYEERRKVWVKGIDLKPQNRDPRAAEGELMCPERFPEAEVVKTETVLGSFAAAGQLQQRPAPRGGGIVKNEWWRYYDPTRPLPQFTIIIDSWDCSFKDTKTSAFVSGQTWAIPGHSPAERWLLRRTHKRLTFTETLKAMQAQREWLWSRGLARNALLIEDKANGTAIIDTLKTKEPGIIAIEPEGSKEARAQAVSPQIEAGNIILPHPDHYPEIIAFTSEWEEIPNGAFWDDADAGSQALSYLANKGGSMKIDAGSAVAESAVSGGDLGETTPWSLYGNA